MKVKDQPAHTGFHYTLLNSRRHATHRDCDFAQDGLGDRLVPHLLEQLVEARGHELHADPDVCVGDEAAQTLDDVRTVVRLEHHIQIHRDALVLLRVPAPPHLLGRRRYMVRCDLIAIPGKAQHIGAKIVSEILSDY